MLATLALAFLQSSSGTVARAKAPIELELAPYFGPLRTLRLAHGEFAAPFLFDTGGGCTVLSLESARALALEPFGRGTGFRHDGARVDGQRAGPLELGCGAFARRQELGVLDLTRMLGGLPPVGGIVALDFFRGEVVTIDLARGRVTVESEASRVERVKGASELEVRLSTQAGGAGLDVMVALEGLHGPLWFELDSGNLAPVLVAPHAFVELGLEPLALGQRATLELPLVGLGPQTVEVESKELIYDGLLNTAFFERHVVTLDLARGRAWVRANER